MAVIPARYRSTRLPGKPLIKIHGKPMIQHVYERVRKAKLVNEVLVATDDKRIFNAVRKFGGRAVMTSKKHKSGTDRVGEAVKRIKCKIVVNVQGDEPFIDPRNIDKAVGILKSNRNASVSTLCCKIINKTELQDPNVVKVVFDDEGYALYFSRSPVPHNRDKDKRVSHYKHVGLYAYRKNYLLKLIRMDPSSLEKAEKLEQLRILENGGRIKVAVTRKDSLSVDTREDLKRLGDLVIW